MFKSSTFVVLWLILVSSMSVASSEVSQVKHLSSCYSKNWQVKTWLNLAKKNFAIKSNNEREYLAKKLLYCLADTNPKIRDGVAFSGLSIWLRSNKLSIDLQNLMFNKLINEFGDNTGDENGIYQPFVALVLAELARADRKRPYLTSEQRAMLVTKSSQYMVNINDYRGFDSTIGWRHNIAHTADLFLQLALNPAITKLQLSSMMDAIGQQVLAKQNHFYIYGEPERLARAMIYILLQNKHSGQAWQNWLNVNITQAANTPWQKAYTSQQGLAKLHNARAFLNAMFLTIADSSNEHLQRLKPALIDAIAKLP